MQADTVRYEKSGKVAIVTLNRPEHNNAFNYAMTQELDQVWDEIKRDTSVVSVLLTAAGRKAFCTGMDLSDVSPEKIDELYCTGMEASPLFRLTAIQKQCWKPVVTAINGMACGGGFHFIADSDLVVAADHATFFDPHVKLGLIAGLEPVGLARRVPLETVLRLSLLGGSERMTSEQALACGLVGEVVPAKDLQERGLELATMISAHSPAALARTKKAIWESLNVGLDQALANTWDLMLQHNDHPDLEEGRMAHLQRRMPQWAPYSEQ